MNPDIAGGLAMVRFQVVSSLENGLDIKRAGEFVKEAIRSGGKVTIRNGARQGDARLIFNVMRKKKKKGDTLEFLVEGENENEEASSLEKYVREHL